MKAKISALTLEQNIVDVYYEVSTDDYYEECRYSTQDGPDVCITRFTFQQSL